MNLRVVCAALLIALPASLQAATPDDTEAPRPQPRIRIERLDLPVPRDVPAPYDAPEAAPTLKQEQRGTIFELWFPDAEANRLPSESGESRLRHRRPPSRD